MTVRILNVKVSPTFKLLRFKTPVSWSYLPFEVSFIQTAPLGNTSYKITPVELFGPLFLIVTVQVTTSSKFTTSFEAIFVTSLSTLGLTTNVVTLLIAL